MDKDTAFRAINFISHNFDGIDHVAFFGGEPTLNVPIVELICRYIEYLHGKEVLPYIPHFSLTTNAYVLNRRLLHLLHELTFSITISLDGPKLTHDKLRRNKYGAPTYDRITHNIDLILDSGLSPDFECTYTNEHLRNGIRIVELIDCFTTHLDVGHYTAL